MPSPSKLDQILELLADEDMPLGAIADALEMSHHTAASWLWNLYRRDLVVPMARDGADWWGLA